MNAPLAPSLLRRCRNHPTRPGIGICVACAATICDECATRVEGILHCRECLSGTAAVRTSPRWRSLSALAPAAALLPLAYVAVAYGLYALVQLIAWAQGLHWS
jgi:hypothetical protein